MKNNPLILCLCAVLLTGCAQTVVYRDGKAIFKTQANAKLVEFRQGDTSLRIESLNHSTPTRAGGSVIGTTGTAAAGVAAALITKGLVQ